MSEHTKLLRGLTLTDATAIVVGSIIGNGVFVKTATMSQAVGSPLLVLLVWVFAGLLSLSGALAYAELGGMMPKAGGEYVFLKEGYGDLWAFLFGWMRFWVGSPGSIAASAVVSATFLSSIVDLAPYGGKTAFSIFLLVTFSLLNCMSVSASGKLQSSMTLIKLLLIAGVIGGIFFVAEGNDLARLSERAPVPLTAVGFGAATLSALWAYDGWNNLPMMAGEVKDPHRNVPRSLIIGMLIVLAIYLTINFAYFVTLPFGEVLNAHSDLFPTAQPVGMKASLNFLGSKGFTLLTVGFLISSIGTMNGGILSSSRIPYAMAKDGLMFRQLAKINARTHVPVVAILVQLAIAIGLTLSGTFEELTNYVVFSGWIFYAMVTSVVFVLRRKLPHAERPYRALGYPVLPGLFIFLAGLLLLNTLYTAPRPSLLGLGFILLGLPVYAWFRSRRTSGSST